MSVITIVGAGMMGSAMCFPACDNGHTVRLVGSPLDRDIINRAQKDGYHITLKRQLPEGVQPFQIDQLEEALQGAELVISGVSSFGADWFEQTVLPLLGEEQPVLSVTKGLELQDDGTLLPLPVAMTNRAKKKVSLNAVGGPVISFELADRQQTEIAFCGFDVDVLKKIKSLLETDYYHISLTTDVAGLECAVAMKNCYALGVALAIGLNEQKNGEGCPEKYNPQAALFEASTREAIRLIDLLGGRTESLVYFAGDLYVTVFGGRTRRIGILLGRGHSFTEAREILSGVTLESVAIATRAAESVRRLAEKGITRVEDFPLLMHIDEIINGGALVDVPWNDFEVISV